jgi:hypothetical protein
MSTGGERRRRDAEPVAMLGKPALLSWKGPVAWPASAVAAPGPEHDAESDLDDLAEVELAAPRPRPGEAVRIDPERAEPVAEETLDRDLVFSAAETMAMLAAHRAVRPLRERASREARILALVDAIVASGPRALENALAWWEQVRTDGDPWSAWVPVFLLGLVDGSEGLTQIGRLIASLGPDAEACIDTVPGALTVAPNAGIVSLADALLRAEGAVGRAIAVETLSRRGGATLELLVKVLDDGAPVVASTAVRALARLPSGPRPVERLRAFLGHEEAGLVWEAARTLTLWGDPEALDAARSGRPLAAALGARAVDLFVMAGAADDLASIEALVARSPRSSTLVEGVARFGHPLAWSFLLHFLADQELADVAAKSLMNLFGPLVPEEGQRDAGAWREAIAARELDPERRYRRGEPWSPAVVARECASGELSAVEIEARLDELRARTGRAAVVDMGLWSPEAAPVLDVAGRALGGARWVPGAWTGSGV